MKGLQGKKPCFLWNYIPFSYVSLPLVLQGLPVFSIRIKSKKSERISPFWVGGYHPFSAMRLPIFHVSLFGTH